MAETVDAGLVYFDADNDGTLSWLEYNELIKYRMEEAKNRQTNNKDNH